MDPSLAPIPLMVVGLLIMLLTLRRFDGFFKENSLFFLFIAGMIIGFVSILLENLISPLEGSFSTVDKVLTIYYLESLVYIIGSSILAEGFKTVVINLPRFRQKREATFMGFGLGIGFGATASIMPFFKFVDYVYPRGIVIPVSIAMIYILVNGATGLVLGSGSARGATITSFAVALGIHSIFSSVILGGVFLSHHESPYLYLAVMVGGILLAIALYLLSLKSFYWGLPDEEKKRVRRALRRDRG